MSKCITTEEAAELIGKSEPTARMLCRTGRIGSFERVNKSRITYRYSAYKIAQYLMIPIEVVFEELRMMRAYEMTEEEEDEMLKEEGGVYD